MAQSSRKLQQSQPGSPGTEGLAAAAKKNRQREARLGIVAAYGRLGIPLSRWPSCVQEFFTDLQQQIQYHQRMTPPPFQPPEFDRLTESAKDWTKKADLEWAQHRVRCLQEFEAWVTAGVDERIVEPKHVRGAGKNLRTAAGGRSRGGNTGLDRRYEWAARYLQHVPLKEIAAADEEPSTVGRVARDILTSAGWTP